MGTGLSLIHLWEPRHAPEAHTGLAPGECTRMEMPRTRVWFHSLPKAAVPPAPGRRLSWRSPRGCLCLHPPVTPQACWPSEMPSWGGGGA